jgi:DNA-binding GntR family transcriptional regulator
LKPIPATRLTPTVYKLLRGRIANQQFAAGERLQVDVLAAQLGVSRTPVREALNQLAAEGLIEIRPRRGTFVAQVDMRTIHELYQLRLIIDTAVAQLLAARLSTRQLQSLTRLVDRLARLVDGESYVDYGEYLECDRAFHSALVHMLDNRRLVALYDEINLPLWLVRAQEHAGAPQDARASLEQHQAILNGFLARDPVATANAMRDHIEAALLKLRLNLGLEDSSRDRDLEGQAEGAG